MALAETGKAIESVSKLLSFWLKKRTGHYVEISRPEAPGSADTDEKYSVFLYEAHFDGSLKNLPLVEGNPAPLWLVLKYIITAYDKSDNSESAAAHGIMGEGIRALQELNYLSITNEHLPALGDNPEPLKITFNEVNSELLSKLMQGPDDKYRFSMGFEVRPIMIVTDEPPSHSLLVGIDYTQPTPTIRTEREQGVHIQVHPSLGPALSGIFPTSFEAGEMVTLFGENLTLHPLSVSFGSQFYGVTGQEPGRLSFKVADDVKDGKILSAGSYPVRVFQQLPDGRRRRSRYLGGNLLPILTSASVTPAAATIPPRIYFEGSIGMTGHLLGTHEDDIQAVLYQDGKTVKSFEIIIPPPPVPPPPPPPGPIQTALTLAIMETDKVPPGTYRLILLVNGQQARKSPTVELTV